MIYVIYIFNENLLNEKRSVFRLRLGGGGGGLLVLDFHHTGELCLKGGSDFRS